MARLGLVFLATLFAVSLGLTAIAAAGGSCGYVNLTDKGQAFHEIPPYDQDGGQICHAYTAAQMIEGERVTQGHRYSAREAASPLSIAINHALRKGQTDLQQGGITCHSVESAKASAVCPEGKSFKSIEEVVTLINDFKSCKEKNAGACARAKSRLGADVTSLAQGNPLVFVKAIEDMTCKASDRITLRMAKCDYVNEETYTADYYRTRADKNFDLAKPKAIEIGYSKHLFNYDKNAAKQYVIDRAPQDDDLMFSIRYQPHASMLLGRRMNAGRCQYLLRNTMGRSFCPEGIVKANGWQCDSKSGGVWINAKELFEATFEISYFQ